MSGEEWNSCIRACVLHNLRDYGHAETSMIVSLVFLEEARYGKAKHSIAQDVDWRNQPAHALRTATQLACRPLISMRLGLGQFAVATTARAEPSIDP